MTAPPDPRHAEGGAAATRTPPGGPITHHGAEDHHERTAARRQDRHPRVPVELADQLLLGPFGRQDPDRLGFVWVERDDHRAWIVSSEVSPFLLRRWGLVPYGWDDRRHLLTIGVRHLPALRVEVALRGGHVQVVRADP